jgi:Ras-related C3 botulinum toxin substrate 1
LLSYPGTDVFLICFSVASPTSLENVQTLWFPEIKKNNQDGEIILVGLKSDLKTNENHLKTMQDKGESICTKEEIQSVLKKIGASKYVECSALMNYNVSTAFNEAIRIGLKHKLNKNVKEEKTGLFSSISKSEDDVEHFLKKVK